MSGQNDRYVLAIDLGTSGPKVALISTGGRVAGCEFAPTPVLYLPGGGAEQRPEDWWNAIKTATRRLLAHTPVSSQSIVGVGCTSQWSGTVALDRDGDHLMNAIIWMDSRGAPYVHRITAGWPSVSGFGVRRLIRWLRLTGGIPAHAGRDSIAHILYIKHEFPELYAATYKFLEPKDYLNLRLTGRFAAAYDSITLHWLTDNRDIDNIHYDDGLIEMSGVDRDKLPELCSALDVLGPLQPAVADELGLPAGIPVVMGTPDVQSAAIGSGAVRDYEGHLYIGTSSWLACHVPFKKTDVSHNIASLPSPVPGRYLVSNEQSTSGACLGFLKDNILFHQDEFGLSPADPDVYKTFDRIAERVPAGSGRLIFTPWLYGERTPVDDRHVRGAIYNLSMQTTREHLIRAVFEGVAYNARWLLGFVEKFVQRPFDKLHMVGGGAKSGIWCQIHADVLNRTILQIQDPIQANVRGAAFLTAVALGYLTFDQVADLVPVANRYTPNPEHRAIYDQLFAEFTNLYRRDKKLCERLNRSQ
jgi:xylulokinase